MKKLSQNQIIGQRGEFLVGDRTLAMGFSFDARNRLETGIDGFLELRNPQTGQTLALWIGAQVKTTEDGAYVREDDAGFEYIVKPDDLAYWRGSNIPVIIVFVRLSDGSMYWKPVDAGLAAEPRRLQFEYKTGSTKARPIASPRCASIAIGSAAMCRPCSRGKSV